MTFPIHSTIVYLGVPTTFSVTLGIFGTFLVASLLVCCLYGQGNVCGVVKGGTAGSMMGCLLCPKSLPGWANGLLDFRDFAEFLHDLIHTCPYSRNLVGISIVLTVKCLMAMMAHFAFIMACASVH